MSWGGLYGCVNLSCGEGNLQLNKLIFLQGTYRNKKQDRDKMIQQKLMSSLTMATFVDGTRIAERFLFNY